VLADEKAGHPDRLPCPVVNVSGGCDGAASRACAPVIRFSRATSHKTTYNGASSATKGWTVSVLPDSYRDRFDGIGRLYGAEALERFAAAHVAVIGLGGVGSWAVEALARSGIGKLTLIDLDDICVSNSNRQLHTLASTVGQSKTATMAARARDIAPGIEVREVEDFITTDNIPEYIGDDLDYVIDAIDSVISKAALIAYCKRHRIRLITIGGAGGQIDPTQVAVRDLAKVQGDPLLAKVRNELRRKHGFSRNPRRKFGVEAVFSTEQLIYPWADGSVCHARPPEQGPQKLDCEGGFGAASFVTGTFAFVAVSRVLQRLARQASS
jgi:tRNA A37 threonylcarbamoyladenosine dehydratase